MTGPERTNVCRYNVKVSNGFLYSRVHFLSIRSSISSPQPPIVQGKYAEAEPLYKRLLEIEAAVHGQDHPEVAANLSNFGSVLESLVRSAF